VGTPPFPSTPLFRSRGQERRHVVDVGHVEGADAGRRPAVAGDPLHGEVVPLALLVEPDRGTGRHITVHTGDQVAAVQPELPDGGVDGDRRLGGRPGRDGERGRGYRQHVGTGDGALAAGDLQRQVEGERLV